MPPKTNPLKLNALQLKTLTLLQAIAQVPGMAEPAEGGLVRILHFPHAHGDHFHIGDAAASSADATGLSNEAVWNALTRKGLVLAQWPQSISLTPAGLAYTTGLAGTMLHRASH